MRILRSDNLERREHHRARSEAEVEDNRVVRLENLNNLATAALSFPSRVAMDGVVCAVDAAIVEPDSDRDVGKWVARGVDGIMAWAQIIGAGPTAPNSVRVGDIDYTVAGGWMDVGYSSADWLTYAWFLAAARRGDVLVDEIGELPVSSVGPAFAPLLEVVDDDVFSPPCLQGLARLVAAVVRGDADIVLALVDEVLGSMEQSESGADELADYVVAPTVGLLVEVLAGDAAGFAAGLNRALLLHNRFWTAAPFRTVDGWGFVSLPLTALVCWAQASGLVVEVDSVYIPAVIVGDAGIAGGEVGSLPDLRAVGARVDDVGLAEVLMRCRARTDTVGSYAGQQLWDAP